MQSLEQDRREVVAGVKRMIRTHEESLRDLTKLLGTLEPEQRQNGSEVVKPARRRRRGRPAGKAGSRERMVSMIRAEDGLTIPQLKERGFTHARAQVTRAVAAGELTLDTSNGPETVYRAA